MRTLNGIHWSNGPQWENERALRVAGPTGAITCLHFQLFPSDPVIGGMRGEDENCLWYGKWRQGFPPQGIPSMLELAIHIRMYQQNWQALDPVAWAEHTADFLGNWRGSREHSGLRANLWDDPFVIVSPCNEQEIEPSPPAGGYTHAFYERCADWQMRWLHRLDQLVPNRKALTMTGAFAGGHDPIDGPYAKPDGEYQIPAVRDMLHAFDVVGVHAYCLLHEPWLMSAPWEKDALWYMLRPWRPVGHKNASDVGGVISQYPKLKYFFSEFGTFVHSDPARLGDNARAFGMFWDACQRSGNVVGATPFIWHSDSHRGNNIFLSEPFKAKLETEPRRPAADWPSRSVTPPPAPTPPPPPAPVDPTPAPPSTETPMPFNPNPYGYAIPSWTAIYKEAARLGWTLLSAETYHDPNPPGGGRGAWSEALCDQGRILWHDKIGVQAIPFDAGSAG